MTNSAQLDQVLPRECIMVIFTKTVTINSRGRELVTAEHGTRGIGFKYGKMKGLKISPPQSVARIDHTSFLCANEASSVSFCLPIHHPLSVLPSFVLFRPLSAVQPPPSSLSFPIVHLPFRASRAGSRNMPFFKQPIRRARRCTCVLSRRFAGAALETWHLRDSP